MSVTRQELSSHGLAASHGPFFVVLNAAAGRRDAQEDKRTISRIFREGRRDVEFLETGRAAPIDAVARHAVALAQARQGVVVAAGGDGTLNAVANAVLGSGCPFGVLPQGTFNYFGREHAIPQDTEKSARALLGASVSPVQVGKVNGRLFLVNASVGLYPQLLEDREAWKRQWGRSRFVALLSGVASLLQSGRQLRLQIESAGQTAFLRTPTLFVGNNRLQLKQAGLDGLQTGAVAQGELAGIALRPIGTLALLGLLVRGLLGRLGDAQNVQSFAFRRLTVMPRGLLRIKVATDGEVVWMRTPLVFEVAPEPLLLMVPAPADRAEVA